MARKEYSNDEITIVWQPKICIHAKVCVNTLPNVYNPNERPWIKIENVQTNELINQITKCPSGALSYYTNKKGVKMEEQAITEMIVKQNGPLLVNGIIKVTNINGSIEEKKTMTAFCRCGASQNKPYCDGSHLIIGFKD